MGHRSGATARRRGLRGALFVGLVIVGIGAAATSHPEAAQPQQAAQDGFVPMGDVPPEDQLPAAPLLMVAYAAVWALAVGYLWTIRRRLGSVEQELADVTRRVADRDGVSPPASS